MLILFILELLFAILNGFLAINGIILDKTSWIIALNSFACGVCFLGSIYEFFRYLINKKGNNRNDFKLKNFCRNS